MRESKLTITVTETEEKEGVRRVMKAECNACPAHMLYAIPQYIASLERSLPEKHQARFRAEFLEELNKARKEILENER